MGEMMKRLVFILVVALQLLGCSVEIGSEAWCSDLKEKPKGEWSMNEVKDYAKYCLLK